MMLFCLFLSEGAANIQTHTHTYTLPHTRLQRASCSSHMKRRRRRKIAEKHGATEDACARSRRDDDDNNETGVPVCSSLFGRQHPRSTPRCPRDSGAGRRTPIYYERVWNFPRQTECNNCISQGRTWAASGVKPGQVHCVDDALVFTPIYIQM